MSAEAGSSEILDDLADAQPEPVQAALFNTRPGPTHPDLGR